MLRYLTAGESHGKCLVAILEGLPAGLTISVKEIDQELARRQKGYGRGMRMKIEKDKVEILSGLRKGKTIGSPIALLVKNNDFKINVLPPITSPRPGHADLAGALKFNTKDIRDVLERASARETAMRVAVGAICKSFLREFKVALISHVIKIGEVKAHAEQLSFSQIRQRIAKSFLNCADKTAEAKMIEEIDLAREEKDTLGGVFEIQAINLPIGLGSCASWERRLDAQLASALMSVPAVKAVEIGAGFYAASCRGSQVHDEILYAKGKGFVRRTNNAGGLEGGMTNGQPLILRCAMKPIATLKKPLASVDIRSKHPKGAVVERADVCAVPACAVVSEDMVAFCLTCAWLEKFAGDSLQETKRNYQGYLKQIKAF